MPDWPWIPDISASFFHSSGIAGRYHHAQPLFCHFYVDVVNQNFNSSYHYSDFGIFPLMKNYFYCWGIMNVIWSRGHFEW
jgi:hypothetical protein